MFLLWVMAMVEFSFAISCPPDFGGRCICGKANYNGRQRYIVNCTNTEFNDAAMLEKLPIPTEVVIFTGETILDYNSLNVVISLFI